MKTSIYNKEEHVEGYVVSEGKSSKKSDVQEAYEQGNDENEVTSFGKESIARINAEQRKIKLNARDGLDNTGTQGYDSLSDDAYNGSGKDSTVENAESHTGSTSKDFSTQSTPVSRKRNEDDVLNTGI